MPKTLPLDSIQIHHCPFQKLEKVAGIRPGSVQLVLTDIPFGKEFLPQLADLAAFAERVLVTGGLFVTYSGQYYLPQVIDAFGKHLTYRWLAMSSWDGDSNMIHPLEYRQPMQADLGLLQRPVEKARSLGRCVHSRGQREAMAPLAAIHLMKWSGWCSISPNRATWFLILARAGRRQRRRVLASGGSASPAT